METGANEDSVLYEDAFQNMKVVQLKQELKTRNLPITGTKNELLARLMEATASTKEASLLLADGNEEDEILDDIPDSPTKDDLSPFAEDNLSPEPVPISELKPTRKRIISGEGNGTEKKLCLNRTTLIIPPPPSTEVASMHTKISAKVIDSPDIVTPKKIIPFSTGLTAQEKLALRAERFNIVTSGTVKLKATDKVDEKPVSTNTSKSGIKPITFDCVPDVDKLKKRAERFGVHSNILKKMEEKDKVKKRQLRFGSAASTNDASLQKTLRAQKFGLL